MIILPTRPHWFWSRVIQRFRGDCHSLHLVKSATSKLGVVCIIHSIARPRETPLRRIVLSVPVNALQANPNDSRGRASSSILSKHRRTTSIQLIPDWKKSSETSRLCQPVRSARSLRPQTLDFWCPFLLQRFDCVKQLSFTPTGLESRFQN
jgi:hypothetical protein